MHVVHTDAIAVRARHGGQLCRYVYSAHWGNDVAFGPAMKHDMQRQTTEVHDFGRGRMTAEPVFVRKPGATTEDEGWIDAQHFAGEPIATIRLPVRVPFGFHGGWAPDRITVVE